MRLVIEEVPAVAGKVNVHVDRDRGKVRIEFGVVQEPRFFERFLKGRPAVQVPYVMSRICGVCSVVHLTCSIEAVEKALGLVPKPEIHMLRSIAKGLEIVQNNFIHVLMALPDFTGHGNVITFSKAYPGLFNRMIETNKMILEAYNRIGGRFVHTPSLGVAVHGKPVSRYELQTASRLLQQVARELEDLALNLEDLWKPLAEGFTDPAPEYCCLNPVENWYPFFSEELRFSDGNVVKAENYGEVLNERNVSYSNSHYVLYRNSPFHVGSRARLQAYVNMLSQSVLELEKTLRLDFLNPFDNVKSQYIEVAYLADILSHSLDELAASIRGRIEPFYTERSFNNSGEGVALAAAPRGVLIHHYKITNGRLEYANIITPTVMNARHMEVAGEALVKWAYDNGIECDERVKHLVSALVRAYDPCLPCSVH
ncbi:MAG: nickel-dependent hydrogenase large subunit [Thermofilaceae archaeon]|nr:nickel-dependent hydrogenase large subunit [Thermofilaceae archaeon]